MPGVSSTWELLTKGSVEQNLSALAKQHRLHCSRDVTALPYNKPKPGFTAQFHPANVSAFPPFQSQLVELLICIEVQKTIFTQLNPQKR